MDLYRRMKRVIIADIDSRLSKKGLMGGHGLAVASMYSNIFEKVCDVKIAGGQGYAKHFKNYVPLPSDARTGGNFIINKIRNLCNLYSLFRNNADSTIILQSCAVLTAYIGIFLFKKKRTKLFMIQYESRTIRSPFQKLLYACIKKHVNGIICSIESVGNAFGRPYCLVPDYIYTGTFSHEEPIPYTQKTYDFCMVGLIFPGKGTEEAAEKLAGKPYQVLIAGAPYTEEVRLHLEKVAASCRNIHLCMGYQSDEAYHQHITRSRYCLMNYTDTYSERSSGVVLDALFRGVPVIARRCAAVRMVDEFNMGTLYEDLDMVSLDSQFSETQYEEYLRNIARYKEAHKAYEEALIRFVLNEQL